MTTAQPAGQHLALVIHPGEDLETLMKSPTVATAGQWNFSVQAFPNGKEAQLYMATNPDKQVRVVIISSHLKDIPALSVATFARAKYQAAEVFVVIDPTAPIVMDETKKKQLRINDPVPGPLQEQFLGEVFRKLFKGINQEVLDKSRAQVDPSLAQAESITGSDEDFVAVDWIAVMAATRSFFDVYLRLGPGKYVRFVAAGDIVDRAQVQRYADRGLKVFFIRKEVQEAFVRYTEQVSSALVKSEQLSASKKFEVALNHGKMVHSLLTFNGATKENLEYAATFVKNVGSVVKELHVTRSNHIAKYLAEVGNYEHNTALAASAGLMAKALKLESDHSVQVIGMAGLLHDLGLTIVGFPSNRGASDIGPADLEKYLSHPEVGAEELRKVKSFDPTVIQAVSQHHFRKNDKGFPTKTNRAYIHVCAEIIGICDDFDYLCRRKAAHEPTLDLKREMEKLADGFSRQVVQAFFTTFFATTK